MKKLNITPSTTANKAVFTSATFDFLQLAYQEGINSSIVTQIGTTYSTSSVYVLYGCVLSVIGGNNVISAGALFFNGEVFLVPNVITLSGTSGTIITNLNLTYYSTAYGGDPMTYTISGPINSHQIRTATFVYGTSGTGSLSGSLASDYLSIIHVFESSKSMVFGGDWTNNSLTPATYRKDSNGFVYLTGICIYSGSTPSLPFPPLFTFPVGYRPTFTKFINANIYRNAGTVEQCIVKLDTSGVLATVVAISWNLNDFLVIEGIIYPIS